MANKEEDKINMEFCINNWECSDINTLQYFKKISDTAFDYIEVSKNPKNGDIYVKASEIDISDWTEEKKLNAIDGFYDSLDEIIATYGINELNHIITECYFEDMADEQCDNNRVLMGLNNAERFVHNYLKTGVFSYSTIKYPLHK